MKKLNIGIVGAGRIGNVHAQSITYHIPGAQVTRVTDVKPEAAKALAEGRLEYDPEARCDHHEHHGGDYGHEHCAEHQCGGN